MNVSRTIVRSFATTSARRAAAPGKDIPQGYFDLKKTQARFQVNDGKPIFLKGGAFDQILYRATMGLSVIALGAIGKLFYDLSVPKSNE